DEDIFPPVLKFGGKVV
ncbi:hypothetical protein NPIL_690521, partial [Nephila pilipes]